jgi:FkbM family methyltransferase
MPDTPPLHAIFYRDFKTAYIPQILEEIYIKKVYDPYLLGKRDLIIADWGGNIGLTSQFFSQYAEKVYCVEPSKAHVEVINTLINYNKIENITVCPYAISNENGTTKFYHPENVTMYSMENVMGAQDFEEVETVDPETFFKREGIDHLDMLKLDVEGSESKVITSDGFKAIAPKIKVIVGEWHTWDSQGKDAFMNTFRDLGYDFHWLANTDASVFTAERI